MTDRYERIRAALAKGPTPGPWEALSNVVRTHPIQGEMGGFVVAECPANIGRRLEDAAHIAACDPDTIRELLAERDQLAAALAAAQQRIACLPADWREDSSLETWFPFTAKQLAAAQQRIAELERELENERARGIHTCHDQCQRPLCMARRRIAELESQFPCDCERGRRYPSHRAELGAVPLRLREGPMTERISNTELLIDAALAAQQPGGSDNGR